MNEIYLQPFSGTKEDFKHLEVLSREDDHGCFYPTEVVMKNGEEVGWFSIGACPTVWAWLSTRKMFARDSVSALNIVEAVVRRSGAPGLYMPCNKKSPFHPNMERLGYVTSGEFDFFFKPFNRQDLIR